MPDFVTAKAVVVNPKDLTALILRLNAAERAQKGRDEWHLPGGVRDDKTEPLPETAKREVREETGITNVEVIAEIDTAEWDAYYEGKPAHFTAHIFELEVVGDTPEVVISSESDDAAWVNLEQLDDYPALMPEAKQAITKVLGKRSA